MAVPPPSPFHAAFSESMIQETLDNSKTLITKWNTKATSKNSAAAAAKTAVSSLFLTDPTHGHEFIVTVQNLRKVMHYYLSHDDSSPHHHSLVLSQTLMQMGMARVEHEFYSLLSSKDPDNGDLKALADCMIKGGYGKECVRIYKVLRKPVVEEELLKVGIGRIKASQLQKMDGEALEESIQKWLPATKNAMTGVFLKERIFVDHVFSASDSVRESCFAESTRDGAISMLKFAEIVAKSRRSSERVFGLMKMHKAITDIWLEIESIFQSESTSIVRAQALSSLVKLSDSVRLIVSEFETSLQKDASKKIIAGGGIHPLTQSAMTYIALLGDYDTILSDIVCDWPSTPTKYSLPESFFDSPKSDDEPSLAVAVRLAWLILVLLCKLDNKADAYKNVSLSYLFLANNLNLIVEKVRTTNLRHILGDEWITKHQNKVKQYALNYEATSWSKVISALPPMGVSPSIEEAREHFSRFNYAFEEAYKSQKTWVVSDRQLRDEMKVSLGQKLVSAYSQFYHDNVVKMNGEVNFELLVRFGPDDLGNYLSDLFYGVSGSSANKRRFWSG